MSANNKDYTNPTLPFSNPFNDFRSLDIVNELSKLRDEISALREALNPPKSAIIVGADVERILRSLK